MEKDLSYDPRWVWPQSQLSTEIKKRGVRVYEISQKDSRSRSRSRSRRGLLDDWIQELVEEGLET